MKRSAPTVERCARRWRARAPTSTGRRRADRSGGARRRDADDGGRRLAGAIRLSRRRSASADGSRRRIAPANHRERCAHARADRRARRRARGRTRMTSRFDVRSADDRFVWHPYTQHGLGQPPVTVSRAQGAYLYADDGRRIFDAVSSWWVTLHGHAHPKISAAIAEQAATLEQVIFAGFTHEPAARLAAELIVARRRDSSACSIRTTGRPRWKSRSRSRSSTIGIAARIVVSSRRSRMPITATRSAR